MFLYAVFRRVFTVRNVIAFVMLLCAVGIMSDPSNILLQYISSKFSLDTRTFGIMYAVWFGTSAVIVLVSRTPLVYSLSLLPLFLLDSYLFAFLIETNSTLFGLVFPVGFLALALCFVPDNRNITTGVFKVKSNVA